ncbi:MAG: M67 family metallopeptidase [Desulfobacterales bacterium]
MLKIETDVIAGMIGHAKNAAPVEACGYLAGESSKVTRQYPLKNIDASETHFSLDPREQFDAVKDMKKRGLALMSVYHSHPETPARPSAEDIKLAYDPDISYVIVSLSDGAETVESFKIKEGRVEKEDIVIFGNKEKIN